MTVDPYCKKCPHGKQLSVKAIGDMTMSDIRKCLNCHCQRISREMDELRDSIQQKGKSMAAK